MFSAQLKVIESRERESLPMWVHKHTFPTPPLRANTVFEARTGFPVGNPGKEQSIASQTEKSSLLANAFTGYAW